MVPQRSVRTAGAPPAHAQAADRHVLRALAERLVDLEGPAAVADEPTHAHDPREEHTGVAAHVPAPAGAERATAPGREGLDSTNLADTLFGQTRRRLLGLFFGRPDTSFYLREVVRPTGPAQGAVQRELKALSDAGTVSLSAEVIQTHSAGDAARRSCGERSGPLVAVQRLESEGGPRQRRYPTR